MPSNRKKVLSGFLWNLGEKLLIQVIAFIVGLILARKLGPETYGIVATVSVIISLLTVITNLYTGTYLMRKKDIDSLDMNTAFYFGLIINIFIYLTLFFTAPLISEFYGKPQLTNLLRVMGVAVLFSSFIGIKMVVVVRHYQYKKLFFASFAGTAIAGVAGIILAYTGFGAWALVAQHCLDGIIDTIIIWIVVKWTPKVEFSFSRLKQMIRYGFPLWLFGIADSFSTRLQQLAIGKKYSSSDLAFYNRGESLPLIIESNTTSSLNDVALRKISEEQDNPLLARETICKITKACLYISFPTMLGLAAVANTTITLLLGSQWLPSVLFMQLFCLSFSIKPIEAISDVALKATGKTKHFFIFGLIKKGVFISSVFIALSFGVEAIAVGFLISSIFSAIISLIVNRICFKTPIIIQLSSICLPLFISFVMWIFVSKISLLDSSIPSILVLLLQIIAGASFYFLSLRILDQKSASFFKNSIVSLLFKNNINNRSKK